MDGFIENVIEFLKNDDRATVTFSQGRFKTMIRKLAAKRPDECEIVAENMDGSICAHIPVAWVKISPPKVLNEKQLEAVRRNILKAQNTLHEKG